jgi:hypothetical protein
MTTRTLICFPTVIAFLSGVTMVEVGVTFVWVHTGDGQRIKLKRSLLRDLIDNAANDDGNKLAFRARQLAWPDA